MNEGRKSPEYQLFDAVVLQLGLLNEDSIHDLSGNPSSWEKIGGRGGAVKRRSYATLLKIPSS